MRPLIVGNWKMNTSLAEATALARAIAGAVPSSADVDVAVCPPFPWLVPVAAELAGSPVALGAQDCGTEPAGAFTGEVAATMLAELCRYVIVGHSERRTLLGESDAQVSAKLRAALGAGLVPILCVGEALERRRAGEAERFVEGQLRAAVGGIEPADFGRWVIAYEPIWAIGTGVVATADDAAAMAGTIRMVLHSMAPSGADAVRILYGGSVSAENAAELLAAPGVEGALVGGASLQAGSFLAIVRGAG